METKTETTNTNGLEMCLNRTMQYGNSQSQFIIPLHSLFKSHYVVWKLNKKMDEKINKEGLNRTMQYGNLEDEYEDDGFKDV